MQLGPVRTYCPLCRGAVWVTVFADVDEPRYHHTVGAAPYVTIPVTAEQVAHTCPTVLAARTELAREGRMCASRSCLRAAEPGSPWCTVHGGLWESRNV